jgi:methyl-accepting chemotaxis protein
MALVKTSKITPKITQGKPAPAKPATAHQAAHPAANAAPAGQLAKAAERVAAATEELAAGLTQASSAAEQLRGAMGQIAAGAGEAAGASQQQLGAIKSIVANLDAARNEAEQCDRRTAAVQSVLAETASQITSSVRSIEQNITRQQASTITIQELARRAEAIGEITLTVSRISDQTNLLALNAAIEAARAGEQGRGFAVVAEEVRALAEKSEKSAQSVLGFARIIQLDVEKIVAGVSASAEKAARDSKIGGTVVEELAGMRQDMIEAATSAQEILGAAIEIGRAALEAQRGAEQVASAAQEQSAAAEEAQQAIAEQARALDQGQTAAGALARLSQSLLAGDAGSAAPQIGATAEQLSATIQELSGAAGQIMVAVDQINRGSQQQAGATQQTSAALVQIEKSAKTTLLNAQATTQRVTGMGGALGASRTAVTALTGSVAGTLEQTQASLAMIDGLEQVSRQIDKVVDKIAQVAMQTTMLAVSGAVEAARAGEAGRGFALVSADIRSLAQEATDSADQVKDTVRGIIDQIASARRSLEHVTTAAEAETEKNLSLFTALDKVEAELAALAGANLSIQQGAKAIDAAVAETLLGARQIAAAAEEASAAARQAAIAAGEQARGAEDLAAAIEEIASLADHINAPDA